MVLADQKKLPASGNAPLKPTSNGSAPSGPSGAAVTPNVWTSSTRTNALKSGLWDARNPSHGLGPKSGMMNVRTAPSDVAGRMNKLNLKDSTTPDWRATGIYDPSQGPTQSEMTTKWRQIAAPSRATDRSQRHAFSNAVCKISNYTRRDFKLGDVIAAPYHVANTNPDCDPADRGLTETIVGYAYSKRRMMVVLFMHQYDLFCLPLFSFSGRGLTAKSQQARNEYVCMKNVGAAAFENLGVHPPVEIMARRPMSDTTTVHVTGGLKVQCSEDISRVGRLTEKSYISLVKIWKGLVGEAQAEMW